MARKGSVPAPEQSRLPSGRLTLLLRLVPTGKGWSWRLFSRMGVSGRPELMFADPKFYRTTDEAREAGRVAVATAMADYTVSGPVAA